MRLVTSNRIGQRACRGWVECLTVPQDTRRPWLPVGSGSTGSLLAQCQVQAQSEYLSQYRWSGSGPVPGSRAWLSDSRSLS